jgi:predicted phage terminase large subunit-like protein
MSQQIEQLMKKAIANPGVTLNQLDKLDCEDSLLDFIKLHWHILEPGRKMVQGKVIEAICEHLEAITSGQIKRLVINVPPGCMKSLTTNVFWPAWEWGPKNMPYNRFIGASYSEALTIRDNRRCKSILTSKQYRKFWGDRVQLDPDQNAKGLFANMATGFKLATSVGGAVVGERGDRFIIDDPHNIKEAESDVVRNETLRWFTEIVPTRINDPMLSAIMMIMQRVHDQDCSGLVLAEELGWDILCLPMEFEPDHPVLSNTQLGFVDWRTKLGELLWEERFPKEYLENELKPSLRAWGGTYAEAGQLQQRPTARGGGMFRKDDFIILDQIPKEAYKGSKIVRGWDLAATTNPKSAFTAGVKMMRATDGRIFLLDVQRIKGDAYEVDQLIRKTASDDGPNVYQDLPQDPGQAGVVQKSHLSRVLEGFEFSITPEPKSKNERAGPFASQVQGGNVYVKKAGWNKAYLNEAALFPVGLFKDQIDATSRAYGRLIKKKGTKVGFGPKIITG